MRGILSTPDALRAFLKEDSRKGGRGAERQCGSEVLLTPLLPPLHRILKSVRSVAVQPSLRQRAIGGGDAHELHTRPTFSHALCASLPPSVTRLIPIRDLSAHQPRQISRSLPGPLLPFFPHRAPPHAFPRHGICCWGKHCTNPPTMTQPKLRSIPTHRLTCLRAPPSRK